MKERQQHTKWQGRAHASVGGSGRVMRILREGQDRTLVFWGGRGRGRGGALRCHQPASRPVPGIFGFSFFLPFQPSAVRRKAKEARWVHSRGLLLILLSISCRRLLDSGHPPRLIGRFKRVFGYPSSPFLVFGHTLRYTPPKCHQQRLFPRAGAPSPPPPPI